MQCTNYREWMQDRSDGTLGAIRSAELDRHLDGCAACRAFAVDLQAIHDATASLEPLAPPDRVWLQLAERLLHDGRVSPPPAPRPASTRHLALLAIAAALVLAVGASIVVLLPLSGSKLTPRPPAAGVPAASAGNAADNDTVQSVEAEFRLAEQHYQNAITKLEQAARLDRPASASQSPGDEDVIDAQTAAMLQKNLQVIDQAIAESRDALRSEPQSAPARDSLFDALKHKVALLQDAIALMNEMRKGNSAGAAQIVGGANKS